ncbi:hypothetical protein V2A60_003132 [Cordyceps javanica]|uniref:Glycerol:H+ symporter (Gup1) n=1 Tax=Cordyceps javanica TaxID=43265 RepID=A0A545V431_9HYPO|nr:glycerol:H+ symporter (Gup1) [Cordyceps javanica]TQW07757.1 glycerol:H+ symporter (Gup1) [Cordyceps javanica]
MGVLSFLKKVYTPDTLDTRFTSSSSVPYNTVIEARSDPVAQREAATKAQSRAAPSKWNTPEFYFYYVVFVVTVPYMFWIAYDVSKPSDPRYHKFERYLSDGWIPGRKIDISDAQYRLFRGTLLHMAALLTFHPLLRRAWNAVKPINTKKPSGAVRLEQRASFDYAFAFVFLFALHGVSALKVLGILYTNHQLATRLPRRYVPAATWIFNICTLFANEIYDGYPLRKVAALLSPPVLMSGSPSPVDSSLMEWGQWLDGFGGVVARWEVLFNITVLRLISFNLDYYWSRDKNQAGIFEKKQLDPANLSEKDRISIPADVNDYSFRNYMAYAIYAPLYLTGPIMTFNDYISQAKYSPSSIERPRTIRYAVRFLLVLLAMELVLHYNYVGAISKASPVWSDYTAGQLSLLSFFNLHLIWLKLLLPWRLSRLWALVDGIDPPENMVRCVSNNYSTQQFWRAWHRSYSRWLVRYLFVPLGGSSFRNWRSTGRSLVTYVCVFTFVALWHDIQLRLLIWGWLIVLFMLPEFIATALFPKRKWEARPTEFRMLCCFGAVFNVLMMITANMVGFAVGLDGVESIAKAILRDWSGLFFLVAVCSAFFVGIQIMFEIRESEKRHGVTLRC